MYSLRSRIENWLISRGTLAHRSYSQCGEDLLIAFLFRTLRVPQPTYMDVGAHDPRYLNNTQLFYDRGGRGVNIEANPTLLARFRRQRRRDVNLNVGVVNDHDDGKMLDFYVASSPTMSTFSAEEAQRLERETALRIVATIQVPGRSLLSLVRQHWNGTFPDLLTIDIEGLDAVIIPSVQAVPLQDRPKVICMETLTYSEQAEPVKKVDLIEAVRAAGYRIYADTHINTVFCREDLGLAG